MTTPHLTRRTLLHGAGLVAGGGLAVSTGLSAPAWAAKTGPVTTCYVEVNSNDLANVARYSLATTGERAFDLGIIFAANINYDGSTAYLHLNERVTWTLNNRASQVQPLQARGTKVLLSILGNHQGAGFANFPDYASADAFAAQLADCVYTYGLDGIDFDDEYADYGVNGTSQPNSSSFVNLVSALRKRMPDKLITLYYIGPASTRLEYNGVRVGDLIDYSWQAYYGTWGVPNVPGLTAAELGPAAVDIASTSASTSQSLARRTVSEGYGVFNAYNLPNGDHSAAVSAFTRELYGSAAVYAP